MLWDEVAHAAAGDSELMRESTNAGAFARYEDLTTLAFGLGLPEDALERSLSAARPGQRPLGFPLYGAWVTDGILTTQGGLVVDLDGRVLRSDGVADQWTVRRWRHCRWHFGSEFRGLQLGQRTARGDGLWLDYRLNAPCRRWACSLGAPRSQQTAQTG